LAHRNARLTEHGRRLLVERVRVDRRPVAHVAKELGVSRQCAHRWVARFDADGMAGLADRSSRPRHCPSRTPAHVEQRVLDAREALRAGPAGIAAETGVAERTVSRILRRHQVPRLADCDPITGTPIRARRASDRRYERARPGELVHIDVHKQGRIPDGGGHRVHGRSEAVRGRGIGYDYIHVLVDDHSRFGYAEALPDETGATAAAFLLRAAAHFAAHGIPVIERVLSDNALTYRRSAAFRDAVTALGAQQRFIRPHCPWTNGKAERFNRTMQTEWAYRRRYDTNAARTKALDTWIEHYNTRRRHHALGGQPPISRLSPT
jgi:transposase InsO family protein